MCKLIDVPHVHVHVHCACVSDLVFVVGGFEEDRATRGPGEIPDGISRCASCLLAPVLMGHVLAMVPPTSKIAFYRVQRCIMLPSPRKRGTHCLCKLCVHVQVDRVQVDCPLCKWILQVGCAS